MTLHEQISDLIVDQLQRLGGLLGRPDITSLDAEPIATRLVRTMTGDDDHARAEASADLYALVCGQHDEPRPEWWDSPLGRQVAASIGRRGSDAVSAIVAAQMLGITRDGVYRLVRAGHLERHSESGITRKSVMARLAEQAAA